MSNTKKAAAPVDHRALLLARINGDARPTTRAALCLDPALAAAYDAADKAYNAAVLARPEREDGTRRNGALAGDPVREARKARDEAAEALRAATVEVVLQAIPEAEFRAYMAAWSALAEDDPKRNDDTDLLRRCFKAVETLDGEPVDLSADDLLELLPHLGAGEAGAIATAAVAVCQARPPVPSSALR